MSVYKKKCDYCGADIMVDTGMNEVTCEYCNNKTIINNAPNIDTNIIDNGIIDNNTNNSIIDNTNSSIIEEQPKTNVIEEKLEKIEVNNTPKSIEEIDSVIFGRKEEEKTINSSKSGDSIKPSKKKKKRKRSIKKFFLSLFFIAIIVASGVIYYLDSQKVEKEPEIYEVLPSEVEVKEEEKVEQKVEEETVLKLAPDVDLSQERATYKNNDIVGRLEIPNLINALVVKGTDNSFYLSHSIKKAYDIRGTEFLDYRLDVTSKQLNIYGHNTRDSKIKVQFLKIEKFIDKEFFDNNQYIVFQHDGGKNIYKIIVLKEVRETNKEHMYVNYTGADFVNHLQNMTTGEGVINFRDVPYDENSEIIVLQTCSHHWDNAFYTLIGVKI